MVTVKEMRTELRSRGIRSIPQEGKPVPISKARKKSLEPLYFYWSEEQTMLHQQAQEHYYLVLCKIKNDGINAVTISQCQEWVFFTDDEGKTWKASYESLEPFFIRNISPENFRELCVTHNNILPDNFGTYYQVSINGLLYRVGAEEMDALTYGDQDYDIWDIVEHEEDLDTLVVLFYSKEIEPDFTFGEPWVLVWTKPDGTSKTSRYQYGDNSIIDRWLSQETTRLFELERAKAATYTHQWYQNLRNQISEVLDLPLCYLQEIPREWLAKSLSSELVSKLMALDIPSHWTLGDLLQALTPYKPSVDVSELPVYTGQPIQKQEKDSSARASNVGNLYYITDINGQLYQYVQGTVQEYDNLLLNS